jgi:hypothetical protein
MRSKSRSPVIGLAIAVAGLAGMALAASSLLGEQETDQVRRDLTRVLSEVYQRAQSRAATGEVVRPDYADTRIELSVPDLSEGWEPSCDIAIDAEQSDPRRYLQALVLVPRDRIRSGGHAFTAYAFLAGDAAVDADLFRTPPDWLTEAAGGYGSLEADLRLVTGPSTVEVETFECPDFSYAIIEGTPR